MKFLNIFISITLLLVLILTVGCDAADQDAPTLPAWQHSTADPQPSTSMVGVNESSASTADDSIPDTVTVELTESITTTSAMRPISESTATPPASAAETVTVPITAAPAESETLRLVSVTSPVGRNSSATVVIQGAPNTRYEISVYYSTTASTAKGLEPASTDANGNLSWTWKVGGRTKAGEHKIVVSGGGEQIEFYFTTTE